MIADLAPTEILERAKAIRRTDAKVISSEDADILAAADRIEKERAATGVGEMIATVVGKLTGQRQKAEEMLREARLKEAEIEALAHKKSRLLANLEVERATLTRLKEQAAKLVEATTPEAERTAMLSRFWARHEPQFMSHLQEACRAIAANRVAASAIKLYVEEQKSQVETVEAEIKSVDKELRGIK